MLLCILSNRNCTSGNSNSNISLEKRIGQNQSCLKEWSRNVYEPWTWNTSRFCAIEQMWLFTPSTRWAVPLSLPATGTHLMVTFASRCHGSADGTCWILMIVSAHLSHPAKRFRRRDKERERSKWCICPSQGLKERQASSFRDNVKESTKTKITLYMIPMPTFPAEGDYLFMCRCCSFIDAVWMIYEFIHTVNNKRWNCLSIRSLAK